MAEQQYPEPTVGTLIFNTEGKIFLMKSHKWHDKYVVPGGHVEVGENIEDAIKREVKEETGLDIYNIEFLLFQEFIYGKEFWKKRHFILFDFACKTNSTKVILNDEGQEYIWISIDEALKLPLSTPTRATIEKYIAKKE